MKKILLIALCFAALLMTGCATASTPPDLKAVHYSGGVASAKKFVDCLDPSSRSGYDPGDTFPAYPTRQVSYDASASTGAERGRFTVVSSDNAELYVPVSVTFRLDTDCDTLRKFHEEVGTRFNAAFDAGGTSGDYGQEWIDLLNFVIGKPLDVTLDRVAQDYTWRDLWNNNEAKVALESAVDENIQALVDRQAGGEFFLDFNVLIGKPDPVDQGLKDAITAEQKAIADARAKELGAAADEKAAVAEQKVAEAEKVSKQYDIDAYGGAQYYLIHECITTPGCNPYPPTYLLGGGVTSK